MKNPLFFYFLLLISLSSFAYDINVPVHYDTLNNGLKIIVVQDQAVAGAAALVAEAT